MDNNIINLPDKTLIINGGNPLEGCPTSWDKANSWADKANGEREKGGEPTWSFDCGFKLDFDGPLIRVSSRFYPPTTHGGKTWDGTVTILLMDKKVEEKKFDCGSLDELRVQVEAYVKEVEGRISQVFNY